MTRAELLDNTIEALENYGYGCMFAKVGVTVLPYELLTGQMMEQVETLYFVKITDDIFENGLASLEGVEHITINIHS